MNEQILERRDAPASFKVGANGSGRKLEGYATVWNSPTTITTAAGSFREVFRPGAFTNALFENADVVAWLEHGRAPLPLGRTKSGTLHLAQDSRGLGFVIDLPATTAAADLVESVRRGDISGMSFAFAPRAGGERWIAGTPLQREVTDADLMDISPVVFPAYGSTNVAVRAIGAEAALSRFLGREPNHRALLEVERARIQLERLR